MILHFSLGKALDDLKNHEAAMEHFDAANRLRRRTARLDRARQAMHETHQRADHSLDHAAEMWPSGRAPFDVDAVLSAAALGASRVT